MLERSLPAQIYEATIQEVSPAGSRVVAHESLTHLAGGFIPVNPKTMEATEPFFELVLQLTDPLPPACLIHRLKRANAAVKIERERLAANQARFELADAELEQFMLRGPFDGQVVQVQTGPGSPVSRFTNLIQIVSLGTYRVDIFLPVVQANELEVGQTIPIQINAPFARSATAKVVFRSPLIEAATGTARVVLG